MANTQAISNTARLDALKGVVQAGDAVKCALYGTGASIGATTAAYTAAGEASGAGYTAGGVAVAHSGPVFDTTKAIWSPDSDLVFSTVSIGPVDCALIYNASRSNAAMESLTFPPVTLLAGDLILEAPAIDEANALLRF